MRAGQGQFNFFSRRCAARLCVSAKHVVIICAIATVASMFIAASGCSRLRLPAIDPNGSQIFLPLPNTTQLDLPRLHSRGGEPGIIPTPAFNAPALPPPCIDGGTCNLLGKHQLLNKLHDRSHSPGAAGEIQMTPKRVIAPVGGEVVLLAGICGKDGYLVKRQPLEWMLSPDSVGTFIDLGKDRPGKLSSLLLHKAPKVEKLDVDFARGRTSSKPALITRGSPSCDDDIKLLEGQTWLSISSPSEGVSRVTVLAPDSEIWDRRRQTATIYWVDAQAQFPQPRIARTGENIELVTRVTKAENLVPAEGWIVRYTLLDPSVATFVPSTGSNIATIRVNSDGQAIARIAALPNSRGTTPVHIEVIRPAQPSDNLPELPIRSEQTFVTFSAPGLNLESFGPRIGSIGEQLSYTASLGNPGDVDAENVELAMTIPAGTKLISVAPQPSTTTNGGLIWEQGILAANRQLDVSVVLEALQASTYDVLFQARAGGLDAQSGVRTEIIDASVDVRFSPVGGIAQAEVGNTVQYEIEVTNTGRQTLTDLKLLIESDPGLPETNQGENKVEQTISMLQPGDTQRIGVMFNVEQQGQLGARLQVRSGQKLLAEKTTSIQGLPERQKRPDIAVSIKFPETIRVGTTTNATITLRNPGEVKLTNLKVHLSIDPAVHASAFDTANLNRFVPSRDGRSATWSVQDMLPSGPGGDFYRELTIAFDSLSPTERGTISVQAIAAEGVQADAIATFRAIEDSVTPPGQVEPPILPDETEARAGSLDLTLVEFGDPTVVGKEMRYGLTVTNNQNQPDRQVRVLIKLPTGVHFSRITEDGISVPHEFGPGRVVTLPNIQFLRSGDSVSYIFVVVPQVPQLMELQAQIFSDGHPERVQASETTTVLPR